MSVFSLRELETYFDEIGCRYKRPTGDILYTGLRCKIPFYRHGLPIQVVVDQYWVTVRGVIRNGIPAGKLPTVLTYLAELNANLRMVRCTTAVGAVVMQADLVRSRCRLENVLEVISAILQYSTVTVLELSVLINNEFVAACFMKLQQSKRAAPSVAMLDVDEAFDFDISANRLVK